MPHYAAFDVSNGETAIDVIDEAGATVWRSKCASDPEVLTQALRRHAPDLVRVGDRSLDALALHTCKALGLTPARHQSGEIDRTGGITQRGDRLMRTYLFEAAASLLVWVRQDSALQRWDRDLA